MSVRKKMYVTIFPELESVHLKKDVGMLPYSMGNYTDYDFKIVTYKKESLSDEEKKEYHLDMIEKRSNDIADFSWYLIKHAREIDVLNLYHITSNRNAYWVLIYKIINPKGKVHLKLDADYRMIDLYNPFPERLRAKIRKFILHNYVDLYTVETSEMLNILKNKWNLNIELLPNGIYINQRDEEFEIGEDVFLTVGRLGTEQKATEVLLQAYALIKNKTTWKLELVGTIEPDFKDYIDNYFVCNPDLVDRVRFVGSITEHDVLKKIYNRAKVFVLPSRWEGFALVLLESLERGEFVIASDQISAIHDLSCDGNYCKIVPSENVEILAEAMYEATKRETSIEIRKERSEWIINNFSWEEIAKKCSLYLKER